MTLISNDILQDKPFTGAKQRFAKQRRKKGEKGEKRGKKEKKKGGNGEKCEQMVKIR